MESDVTENNVSRRAVPRSGWLPVFPAPAMAAAQSAGVKHDDLAIKEVKVYVLKGETGGEQRLASLVTNSGIEGNYTLAPRYFHPNWSNLGWLDYAKRELPGKSALDLPAITSQWAPSKRRRRTAILRLCRR